MKLIGSNVRTIILNSLLFVVLILFVNSCVKHDMRNNPVIGNSPIVFGLTIPLSKSWSIQSAKKIDARADFISTNQFDDSDWISATVPTTVLNALVEDGQYKDVYIDNNLENIPKEQFKSSWWYRTGFDISDDSKTHLLNFEGINYTANIWLNGQLVADTSSVNNTFKQYRFDISKYLVKGENTLAVEVLPPTKGDFSIGFVDWNPSPPDNNMGIFRTVYIETNDGVSLSRPYIVTEHLSQDYMTAELSASVEITNHTNKKHSGELSLGINNQVVTRKIILDAGETKIVRFSNKESTALIIHNPQLWWPHTIGEPIMHNASFGYSEDNHPQTGIGVHYGIRTVSDYFTKEGHRGFKVNGQKILIKGGGWVDMLMLEDTHESIKNQLSYVKDMNLNTIRLEGFWGKDQALYEACDNMGILIMVGYSCHWEWEDYLGTFCSEEYGGILSENAVNMMSEAWEDQVIWLRNHPSIFSWVGGSDCIPKPELEKKYLETFKKYDSSRIYLASAKEWSSTAGHTGVKMRGPYAYVPPVYWYSDTLYGGAFGFNTETGPGAQVPPMESMKKMLSAEHHWPIDDMWNFHCGRNEFNKLDRFTEALEKRYGKATSLADYTMKAQVLNYELMRPMFEAFASRRESATGVIQWMLNSAWPETYWQLYDFYLMPNGAYYGAKKASQPYHAIYNYDEHAVYVSNDKLENLNGASLRIRAYNLSSQLKYEKEISIEIKANSSIKIIELPKMDWVESMYFLDIRILNKQGIEIDNNFYWISKKKDILDYKAEVPSWNYHTLSAQYADFSALDKLPKGNVISSYTAKKDIKGDMVISVALTNESDNIAFFVNPKITDKNSGKVLLPIRWSDNYISLLPNEKRILKARLDKKYLKTPLELLVESYNSK